MKSCEELVDRKSEYYIYAPSMLAQKTFLYLLQCGNFTYLPGYRLIRESFDSLLLIYVQKGTLILNYEGHVTKASEGYFLFLDCYKLHEYYTRSECQCLWCHFDGISAKPLYHAIVSRLGNVFYIPDAFSITTKLQQILDIFEKGKTVREPLLSKYLNDMLTAFLLYTPSGNNMQHTAMIIEEAMTYINEHFSQNIAIQDLSDHVGISSYHFIRTFKKETGFTPHEYLVNTRMAHARYLLKNTKLPVKDICFQTGFASESVFCSAFKKKQGLSPSQYRNLTDPNS